MFLHASGGNWECPICENNVVDNESAGMEASLLHARRQDGAETIFAKVANWLESRPVQISIIILTMMDLAFVMIGLSVTAMYGEDLPESGERIEAALGWGSIAILTLFSIEQIGKILILGITYFLNAWHVLDFLSILSSLILEIMLRGPAGEIAALLIAFRLWRSIRMVHGGVMIALKVEHHDTLEAHHRLMCHIMEKNDELEEALKAMALKDNREATSRGKEER